MGSDVKLFLREDYLKADTIVLEAKGYDDAPREAFEDLVRSGDSSDLRVSVHRDTGAVLGVTVEEFRAETEYAIKMLREYPLPWTFTLESMGIKEKPLEDVLLAVWKKYKGIKMEWE